MNDKGRDQLKLGKHSSSSQSQYQQLTVQDLPYAICLVRVPSFLADLQSLANMQFLRWRGREGLIE